MTEKKNKSPLYYADLGLQFAIAVALGLFFGNYLDNKISSSPLFLIIGVLIGAVAGFLNIYRAVYPRHRQSSIKNDNEKA